MVFSTWKFFVQVPPTLLEKQKFKVESLLWIHKNACEAQYTTFHVHCQDETGLHMWTCYFNLQNKIKIYDDHWCLHKPVAFNTHNNIQLFFSTLQMAKEPCPNNPIGSIRLHMGSFVWSYSDNGLENWCTRSAGPVKLVRVFIYCTGPGVGTFGYIILRRKDSRCALAHSSVWAERVGQREVGGVTCRVLCTWQLPGLAIKEPWFILSKPIPTLVAWTGIENATLTF